MQHSRYYNVPSFKDLKALMKQSKVRRQRGQTVLEGIHLADSYLRAGGKPVACFISDSAQPERDVSEIVAMCEHIEVPFMSLTDSQFSAVSGLDNGVGLLLVIEMPEGKAVDTLTHSAVLLDRVQDPGNVGTILRTAAAAGITQVYCSAETASIWSPKVLRAGMGAHFALSIYENVDLSILVQEAQIPVLVTALNAQQSIYDVDLSGETAWIVGNEGQGVSPELLAGDVRAVIIPQNSEVESLNVAAATAVCLFEQRRQTSGA